MSEQTNLRSNEPARNEIAAWKRWLARLVSFFLAIGVWFAVISEDVIERTLTIPIIPYADQESLLWVGDPPGMATVRLQGKARTIWWMEYVSRPEIRIPLSTLPISGEVKLRQTMVELPPRSDVKILAILQPELLPVRVERYMVRLLPIKVAVAVEPIEGYIVSQQPASFPANVEISGTRTRINELDSITTEPIVLDKVSVGGRQKVKLLTPAGVKLGLSEVEIRYEVERLVEERIDNVPVILSDSLEADPPWISLRVSGPASEISALRKKTVKAKIGMLLHNATEAVPQIDLPPTVRILSIVPPQVKVRRR
ncbi:MAG: CdaR family protein [bacterium]|nr:CdaR family protein [bacterium]